MKFILTILILFIHQSLFSQCLVTRSEYKAVTAEIEELDPIVGFWRILGETTICQGDSTILIKEEPSLDFWIIIPYDNDYKVCHTEYTETQYFKANFSRLDQSRYQYEIYYENDPLATTTATLIDESTPEQPYEKVISYVIQVPEKKAKSLGVSKDQQAEWTLYWIPVDDELLFTPLQELQEEYYQEMHALYANNVVTMEEKREIERVANNDYVKHIREKLDSDRFFNIIGTEEFPANISDDTFTVVDINDIYPHRRSYYILFNEFDDKVWRVDFNLKDHGSSDDIEIISFNSSLYHGKKSIKLIKSDPRKGNIWK